MNIKSYIPYYKRNLCVAFPVMLTQLGGALVGLVDSIMVGHYSTTDLAAVSFANGIFFTIMVFAMGSVMGLTPLVGQAYIQGRHHDVARLLRGGLVFTLLLAGATCSILFCCVPFINDMGQETAVAAAAKPYLITRIIGLFPFLMFCLSKQFLEGLGNTMVAMLITFGCNLLNIFLNYLFIFGAWGCPEWGAFGAGFASMLASIVMPILFFIVIVSHKEWKQYISVNESFKWETVREIAKVGFPIGGQTVLETISFTLSFIMVGWISKEALAAHTVSNQIADLTFMIAMGIGAATTIRVSHQYGLRDWKAMRMAANASIHLVLLMNAIGATLMISLRHYIPMLFTEDEEVIRIASRLLIYAGIFQFSDGLQCVGAAMLRGITDVRMPVVYCFIAYILVALPVGYIMMFPVGLGVEGMWIGFIAGLFLAAVFFHARFRKKYKQIISEEQDALQIS